MRSGAFGAVKESTVIFVDTSKTKKAGKNPTVKELKAFLKEVGIKVKGNPRKAVLEEMFEEVRTERTGNEAFEAKLEAFNTEVLGKEKSPKEEEEDELLNSPLLSEKEKRIALYELRRKNVKAKLARLEERKRLACEIREKEARRAQLIRDKQCETSDEEDSDSSEDEVSDSEGSDSYFKIWKNSKPKRFGIPTITHIVVRASWIQDGASADKSS